MDFVMLSHCSYRKDFLMLLFKDRREMHRALCVCNEHGLKREILRVSDSDYEKKQLKETEDNTRSKIWHSFMTEKAREILKGSFCPHKIEDIIRFVPSIGMRMLLWAEYHEGVLGLPRGYSVDFLQKSFFTERGIIDRRKAAEALIADESLSLKLRYKLACLHCLTDRVHTLFCQMTEEDKEEFCDFSDSTCAMQPGLVKYWTYCMMHDGNRLRGEKLAEYKLEVIAESGNQSAFEHWLEETGSRKNDGIVKAAIKTVGRKLKAYRAPFYDCGWDTWDWIVLRRHRDYYGPEKLWTPSDYYVDAVVFLLSQMNEHQKVKFLKEDIEGSDYDERLFRGVRHSNVLEFFLSWPYQDLFMNTARMMWEFLPEESYAILLLKIANKFGLKDGYFKYGEEDTYDYKKLLMDFWEESPNHYKKYVLSDNKVPSSVGSWSESKTCTGLLRKLITLPVVPYTHIEMILSSATKEEKEKIFASNEWIDICDHFMKHKLEVVDGLIMESLLEGVHADKFRRELRSASRAQSVCIQLMERDEWETVDYFIKSSASPEEEAELRKSIVGTKTWNDACCRLIGKEKWEELDEILLQYLKSKEEVNRFKKEFASKEDVRNFCISTFIKREKWDAAESFLEWTALTEDEVKELKRKMIGSAKGIMTCCFFMKKSKVEAVDRFIRWNCLPEKEMKQFNKSLMFSDEGIEACRKLALEDKLESASEFISYCLCSEEEIREFKRMVACKTGCGILKQFLTRSNECSFFLKSEFTTSMLKRAENFLAWCFSSEEEINEYKRNVLLGKFGEEIHFELIRCNQWEAAEEFFALLRLSSEEISELKKNTLFHLPEAKETLCRLLCSESDEIFGIGGSKQKAIELISRWYLTDEESVTKFTKEVNDWNFGKLTDKEMEVLHKSCDSVVTQRLKDFGISERKES